MVLACCILHNVCEVHGDTFVEEWLETVSQPDSPQPNDVLPPSTDDPEAEEVRSLLRLLSATASPTAGLKLLQLQQPPNPVRVFVGAFR
ncbi:hypothetical protein AGOR_G00236720 [Albula goreensis]|uniref:DDE Tnp4 domain-containing protein n=1 Tax=Albula goreensis TaxID=1534307 RepID=A0A8T3CCU7_9TELE|nr:hypothetical protein AGOR_G00236720 [Albula goreensis]